MRSVTALHELSAVEMVAAVRESRVSRRELVAAHLERIAAHDGAIQALVEVRGEAALAEAEAADRRGRRRSAARSRPRGRALDGLPMTVKDHFDLAGSLHTEGVRAQAGRRSSADAVAVSRLRAAGAIIVAKANQPDWQIRWNTVSELNGTTRNPRDLSRSAGGSSGGDAAAVTAGFAGAGLGLDYGGSIRVPAAFCGIYGLRPSAGRVPEVATLPPFDGPPTWDLMSSDGPLARTVDDLELLYGVLAGPHPGDPASLPLPLLLERRGAGGPTSGSRPRPRVTVMIRETGAIVDPPIEAAVGEAAGVLAAAGYPIEDGAIPGAGRAPELWAELIGTELLEDTLPSLGAEGIGASGRQHIETMFGLFTLGREVSRYIAAFRERRALVRAVAAWMETHPLVLAPIAGMTAPPLDFDEGLSGEASRDLFDQMRDVTWVNLLGLPAIAFPSGVQLVARRFHEAELFAAARILGAALGPATVAEGPW